MMQNSLSFTLCTYFTLLYISLSVISIVILRRFMPSIESLIVLARQAFEFFARLSHRTKSISRN